MRTPDLFLDLLDRIEEDSREYAIGRGFKRLLDSDHTASIEPLLVALGDRTAKGKRLKDVAIRGIFYRALNSYDCDVWVKRFHNHPVVTPAHYFSGFEVIGGKV